MSRRAGVEPDPVVGRIREMVSRGLNWSLEGEEIRQLLGVSSEEFYRRIYAAESRDHPLISLDSAAGSFSQENIWEFVALMELFCGAEAEVRLEEAGIYFSHPEQMEILGVFLGEAAAAIRSHDVDAEQFSAMLKTFGRFERARDVYIREYFPLTGLIEGAAQVYVADRIFTIRELALANVKRLLEFFFQKHVLQARNIFAVLIDRLLRLAVEEGYAAEYEGMGERRERAPEGMSDYSVQLHRARQTMSLEGRSLNLPLLKAQYKRLMKIYHPDINPRGLRRCQEITAAYSLLLSSL